MLCNYVVAVLTKVYTLYGRQYISAITIQYDGVYSSSTTHPSFYMTTYTGTSHQSQSVHIS